MTVRINQSYKSGDLTGTITNWLASTQNYYDLL